MACRNFGSEVWRRAYALLDKWRPRPEKILATDRGMGTESRMAFLWFLKHVELLRLEAECSWVLQYLRTLSRDDIADPGVPSRASLVL